MNPTMEIQQATEENKRDAAAILLVQREKNPSLFSELRREYASPSEKHNGPSRRIVYHAKRATPYAKNRRFASPPVSSVDELYTNARRNFHDTLLRHIKLANNAEVSSMLEGVSNVHQLTDGTGTTLLHFAAKYGNTGLVQHLINLEATIDAQDRHSETPLIYAVKAGQEATVILLLNCNADILLPGYKYCALGKALSDRPDANENIVSALLDRVTVESLNASEYVKTKQFHSTCPLHHFIALGNVEITRLLLEKGSLVDAKCEYEETALHKAARQLDLEQVKLLIKFGANVNAQTNYDTSTPLMTIRNFEDQGRALAVVQVLVAAGASLIDGYLLEKPMKWRFLKKGNREIVRAALKCPIDFQSLNDKGMSPLHYLASNRHADVLKELRGVIFDFNVRCGSNGTLLHYAARAGNLTSVEFLINRRFDVDARDEFECTPLVWAMRCGSFQENIGGHMSCIETLLEHGASPRFWNELDTVFVPRLVESLTLFLLAKPVIAYSALLEASGRPIDASVMEQIESRSAYKTHFVLAKFHLEEMAGIWIFKAMTLFDILVASDQQISMYARNPGLVFNLSNVMKEYNSESYLHCKLRARFSKIAHLAEMRKSVTDFVNEVLSKMLGLNVQNVAQTIVNFVGDQDLHRMLPVPE